MLLQDEWKGCCPKLQCIGADCNKQGQAALKTRLHEGLPQDLL